MESITLNGYGDLLRFDYYSPIFDSDLVGKGIIFHNQNCHIISIVPTPTHYRVVCGLCGTMAVVPIEVITYGKLREWCREQIRRWRSSTIRYG